MRDWPQVYRDDTGVTERVCPCGVGHPDPDQPFPADSWQWIHGCCGCCNEEVFKRKNDKVSQEAGEKKP